MKQGKSDKASQFTCLVETRVTQEKYKELSEIVERSYNIRSLSQLVRYILENKPITLKTQDESVDGIMEELASIQEELRSIGVNINQVTRVLHQLDLPEAQLKESENLLGSLQETNRQIAGVSEIINQLSQKWLPE